MSIIPKWFHSVRSLVTLFLTMGFIVMCLAPIVWGITVGSELLTPYLSVYIVTLNYYFREKQRNGEDK